MAKVYQPGDPRDFGEAMVYAHKLEMQRDKLRESLEQHMTALDDWLNTYCPEFCDDGDVADARSRIHKHGGTLAYIAGLQEKARAALGDLDADS